MKYYFAKCVLRESEGGTAASKASTEVSSQRQQVAPAIPARTASGASPYQASPSVKVRSAIVTDPAELAARLSSLGGIERAILIEVGGSRAESIHEVGRSRPDRTSSVHYLRFRLTDAQRAAFLRGDEVAIAAEHEGYRARAVLTEDQRTALAADLLGT